MSACSGPAAVLAQVDLGGVPNMSLTTPTPLASGTCASCPTSPSAYVPFAAEPPEGPVETLRPVTLTPPARYDEDLITIPKYAGKTNEQFTRLLLNVTVLASAKADAMFERRLVVFDPLADGAPPSTTRCGTGTTRSASRSMAGTSTRTRPFCGPGCGANGSNTRWS